MGRRRLVPDANEPPRQRVKRHAVAEPLEHEVEKTAAALLGRLVDGHPPTVGLGDKAPS